MAWIETTAAGFEAMILQQLRGDTETLKVAALETAQRGLYRAVRATNAAGSVDRGQFKRSWRAVRTEEGAELRNDAPYAGVIEYGRRPGRPGPPLAPIYEWVQRKLRGQIKAQFRVVRAISLSSALNMADKDAATREERRHFRAQARASVKKAFGSGDRAVDAAAWGIAMAIRDKIHSRGTKPRFILRGVARVMGSDFEQAALRQLRRKYRG